MKKFNKTFTVIVQIDAIANKMLSTIDESNPHRELITEAIIGSAVEKNTLSYIYNALHGFTNDIDFKVGDVVFCESTCYSYTPKTQDEIEKSSDQTALYKSANRVIGECKIIEINEYAENKVRVEFESIADAKGEKTTMDREWVNHTKLKAILEEKVEAALTATKA